MIQLQYPFGAFGWPDTISLQTFLETSTLGVSNTPANARRLLVAWPQTREESWRGCPLELISDMSNMLSPLMIGLLVFVLILTGTFVGRSVRRLLPRDDLTDETKSLVSVSMAVVSTISALVLGLLISNANSSFIALGGQVTSLSAQILRLDQILRRYGPQTEPAREILRQYAEHKAEDHTWAIRRPMNCCNNSKTRSLP
jgi:hypothetical protein